MRASVGSQDMVHYGTLFAYSMTIYRQYGLDHGVGHLASMTTEQTSDAIQIEIAASIMGSATL